MKQLLDHFESESKEQFDELLDTYKSEAQAQKEQWILEGKRNVEREQYRYQKQIDMHCKQALSKTRLSEKSTTNSLKQELIHEVIDECIKHYKHLDNYEYQEFLATTLSNYVSDERPRIYSCPRFLETTKERFGEAYQVIEDKSLKDGFILSFDTYNVNFEIDEIFAFHHQDLMNTVLHNLFPSGEDDA